MADSGFALDKLQQGPSHARSSWLPYRLFTAACAPVQRVCEARALPSCRPSQIYQLPSFIAGTAFLKPVISLSQVSVSWGWFGNRLGRRIPEVSLKFTDHLGYRVKTGMDLEAV